MPAEWIVRLGQEWARHTYARAEGDGLRLLGTVQCGAQIGALAVDADGQYYQLNGDHVSPLNTRRILQAMSEAKRYVPREFPKPAIRGPAPTAPTVVVRRKRVLAAR